MPNQDPALFTEFAEFKRWRETQMAAQSSTAPAAQPAAPVKVPATRRARQQIGRLKQRAAAPPATPLVVPPPTRMVDKLAPSWAYEAAYWIAAQDASWRSAAAVISAVLLVLGGALLFGSGYTSIQGVRVPLDRMGLPVDSTTFPPIQWWLIPIANVVVQIFAKHIPRLRVLWRPSIMYDGITNAVYLAGWSTVLLLSYSQALGLVPAALIGSVLGLLLAVCAEKIFLAAVCLLRAAYTGRF